MVKNFNDKYVSFLIWAKIQKWQDFH